MQKISAALLIITMLLTNTDVIAGEFDYRGNGVSRLIVHGFDDADSLAHTGSIKSIQYALYDALMQSGRKIEKPWEVVMVLNLSPYEVTGSDLAFEQGVIEGQSEPIFRIVASKTITVRGDVIDRAYKNVLRLEQNQEFQKAFEQYSKAMNQKNAGEMSRIFMSFEALDKLGIYLDYTLSSY